MYIKIKWVRWKLEINWQECPVTEIEAKGIACHQLFKIGINKVLKKLRNKLQDQCNIMFNNLILVFKINSKYFIKHIINTRLWEMQTKHCYKCGFCWSLFVQYGFF